MTDGPLHFTKRELQRLFFAPRFWAALGGAAVLLGLAGPFGTYEALALPARLAYWAAVAAATYLTGVACVFFLARLMSPRALPRLWHFVLSGALAGIPVAAVVWALNEAVFGPAVAAIGFSPLVFYTAAISAVVSALVPSFTAAYAAAARDEAPDTGAPAKPSGASAPRPRILERLPAGARGELARMTVQDHYVEVHTDRGSALVLMRLADAIAEAEGVAGLQVHRSHWVAARAVERPVRRDGRLFLQMGDGTLVPVSRTFQPAVRSAGLA